MSFGDLSTTAGLIALNDFLLDNSFVGGVAASDDDFAVLKKLGAAPDKATYPHIVRWHKTVTAIKPDGTEEVVAEEDEVDLFGSDDEDDEEAERIRAERAAEYQKKKAAKGPAAASKSLVTLDVKGWDDETDMNELTENVKKISMDGLVWGSHQLVPVGFGINKLQINCVVEDDKVSLDDLAELIQEDEDHVQSVDVAAMSKL